MGQHGRLFLVLALLSSQQLPAQEHPLVFRLVQMNGRSLPAVDGPGGACDRELTEGELRLHEGRYTIVWTMLLSCEGGKSVAHEHDAGTYVRGGPGIRFRSQRTHAPEFGGVLREDHVRVSLPQGSYLFRQVGEERPR